MSNYSDGSDHWWFDENEDSSKLSEIFCKFYCRVIFGVEKNVPVSQDGKEKKNVNFLIDDFQIRLTLYLLDKALLWVEYHNSVFTCYHF